MTEASNPRDYVDHDWLQEKYSKGCYTAFTQPGTLTKYGTALREPVGRIFWSGTENAEIGAGYIEGAINSGRATAGTLLIKL